MKDGKKRWYQLKDSETKWYHHLMHGRVLIMLVFNGNRLPPRHRNHYLSTHVNSVETRQTPHVRTTRRTNGEGGIRTHGGRKAHSGFQDRRIQPLCHLSKSVPGLALSPRLLSLLSGSAAWLLFK